MQAWSDTAAPVAGQAPGEPQWICGNGGQRVEDLVTGALNHLVPGGVRRGELRRGARTLRWVEAGSGTPVVVLDAGLGEPGTLAWAGVLPALAATTRTIAYDRAGIGCSDPLHPETAQTAVGDLAAIAKAAGGPCVLAGHSWGGLLAQMVALRHPRLAAGLALVDPAHEELWAVAPRWYRTLQFSYGAVPFLLQPFGLQAPVVRAIYRPFAERLTDDPGVRSQILDAYASCYRDRSQVRAIHEEDRLAYRAVAEFRRIRLTARLPHVPLIVLSASRGLPPRLRRPWTRLQSGLAESAGGTHRVVDTGHSIHQERPQVVADAIGDVIARVRALS